MERLVGSLGLSDEGDMALCSREEVCGKDAWVLAAHRHSVTSCA